LSRALDEKFDLEELRATESSFEQQFMNALENDDKVLEYVQRLERRYDARAESEPQEPMPSPEEMVTELEEFLKRRLNGGDDQGSQSS
jgi:hypothetical protein